MVNNNAAAVLLALAALAEGREVLVSRGELIEIGGGFRIPDVLRRSGARLVEVGTTNRTRADDYERAIGPETGAAPARAPVELPRRRLHRAAATSPSSRRSRARHGLPLVDDLGSGVARRASDPGLGDREPTVRESARARAPTSSASPATSCSAGRRPASSSGAPTWSSGCGSHPLMRALRPDKLTLAALEATLALYRDGSARRCCACSRSRPRPCGARAERLAQATRRRGRGDGRPLRRRRAAARGDPELRVRARGGARGAAARARAAGRRRRPRRPAAARLPHPRRRRGRRGRRRGR